MPLYSPDSSPSSPRRDLRGALALGASLGAFAILAGSVGQGVPELRAEEMAVFADSDGDKLTDIQESVLGTNPLSVDSDADGLTDLEEVARGSNPSDILDFPLDGESSVGVAARVEGDYLLISTAFYLPENGLGDFDFAIGARIGDQIIEFSPLLYLSGAIVDFVDAGAGKTIVLLQTPYPAASASALGSVSFYGTLEPLDGSDPGTADGVNIVDLGNGALSSIELSSNGGGSLYTPLGAEGSSPASSPGQACVQDSAPVGNSGPIVTHLVESAGCEDADSSCSDNCDNLAGSVIDVLDPSSLIGG